MAKVHCPLCHKWGEFTANKPGRKYTAKLMSALQWCDECHDIAAADSLCVVDGRLSMTREKIAVSWQWIAAILRSWQRTVWTYGAAPCVVHRRDEGGRFVYDVTIGLDRSVQERGLSQQDAARKVQEVFGVMVEG